MHRGGEAERYRGRKKRSAKAHTEDERRAITLSPSVLSLTVTEASPEFHPCFTQCSPFSFLLLVMVRG